MPNTQNLKSLRERPQRERNEIARKGAEASNKAQAQKKQLRAAAEVLLTMPVDEQTKNELKPYHLKKGECTYAMALVAAQLKKALQGDTRAFNAIRDIVGERPKDTEIEVTEDSGDVTIVFEEATSDDTESDVF